MFKLHFIGIMDSHCVFTLTTRITCQVWKTQIFNIQWYGDRKFAYFSKQELSNFKRLQLILSTFFSFYPSEIKALIILIFPHQSEQSLCQIKFHFILIVQYSISTIYNLALHFLRCLVCPWVKTNKEMNIYYINN